jgi:hypothetical protein
MARKKMISPRQYAEATGTPYTTVMTWLQKGMIPGAHKEDLQEPFKGYIYRIPEGAPPPELKPGPKPGSKKKAG